MLRSVGVDWFSAGGDEMKSYKTCLGCRRIVQGAFHICPHCGSQELSHG